MVNFDQTSLKRLKIFEFSKKNHLNIKLQSILLLLFQKVHQTTQFIKNKNFLSIKAFPIIVSQCHISIGFRSATQRQIHILSELLWRTGRGSPGEVLVVVGQQAPAVAADVPGLDGRQYELLGHNHARGGGARGRGRRRRRRRGRRTRRGPTAAVAHRGLAQSLPAQLGEHRPGPMATLSGLLYRPMVL